MFEKVFVEEEVRQHPRTEHLLSKLKINPIFINQIDDYFGRVRKPYLQKRDNLNLFIGKKRGKTVKIAPDAYGLSGEPHYYFIHAYNCIYECEYCYLQGYFNSPDIVFFINHEDIAFEMKSLIESNKESGIWFHAGEFSDSLAMSHFTGEIPFYFDFFKKHPKAKLEFRTKSANTRELEKMVPLSNVITTFSLSPQERAEKTDRGCPPISTRILAMEKLYKIGHPLGYISTRLFMMMIFSQAMNNFLTTSRKRFQLIILNTFQLVWFVLLKMFTVKFNLIIQKVIFL